MDTNNKKTALITGGSSGLGLAMAKQLASEGYHSVILARGEERINKAVEQITGMGYSASGFKCDISSVDNLKSVAHKVKKQFGTIDYLILNAGVCHVGLLTDDNILDKKQDIDVDLWGTIASGHTFVPMLATGSKVLMISSALGLVGAAGYSTYCAAKAGIISFGETLRRELLFRKIPVYVACPGDIDTPQYAHEQASMPSWMKGNEERTDITSPEVVAAKILKKCKGKRFLVLSDFEVWQLVTFKKLFRTRLFNFIFDRIFPVPQSETA
ncbi:MAG: SDR family NAD(P)-dependent oxidoreductase [bacterium]|nr:SDR family NAD(P)-dependent oxidoreductase [bacterium]